MFNVETWVETFQGVLRRETRWDGVEHLARNLARKRDASVLEFHCATGEEWYKGGALTPAFDWMAKNQEHGGRLQLFSVDPERKNVEYANQEFKGINTIAQDPVEAVADFQAANFNLVYFSRRDLVPEEELKIVGVLALLWPKLPSGALFAVDARGDVEMKNSLVRQYFEQWRHKPELSKALWAWRKP